MKLGNIKNHPIKGGYTTLAKLAVVVGITVVGTLALLTHALVPQTSVSVEPEQGTINSNACATSDANASGGQVVKLICSNIPSSDSNGVTADRTIDLARAIGINVHMNDDSYADATKVLHDLQYLGVNYVRNNDFAASTVADRQMMAANGIKFEYVTPKPSASSVPTSAQAHANVDKRISDIKNNNLQSSTSGVEGINEYDANIYTQPGWAASYLDTEQYLYSQMRANFGTTIPVLNSSLTATDINSSARLIGDISGLTDIANFHTYPGINTPESSLPDRPGSFISSAPCSQQSLNRNIDDRIAIMSTCMTRAKPVIASETGYQNYLQSSAKNYVSAAASGAYIPRALLETFRIGFQRTYIYQLLDQPEKDPDVQAHFGVFYPDNSAKPAAQAIHGLTTLLTDGGPIASSFTPGKLDYQLTGSTANLHRVLLQKSDGSFWLALWQADSVWNNATQTDIAPTTKNITLTLAVPTQQLQQYSLANPASATDLGAGSSFTISTGPTVSLLRISR